MIVKLTYFRKSGKYYSDGEYETEQVDLYRIWNEVQEKLEHGKLPGLEKGHSHFIVSVDVPGHQHNHPHLVI